MTSDNFFMLILLAIIKTPLKTEVRKKSKITVGSGLNFIEKRYKRIILSTKL